MKMNLIVMNWMESFKDIDMYLVNVDRIFDSDNS